MKILILTFYYSPDLCAGSFRMSALTRELKGYKELDVEIVTTFPNRYSSFKKEVEGVELDGNLKITRIKIPSHKSGMVDQIKSFFSYYRGALGHAKNIEPDLVFATSSRLATAFLGYQISRRKKLPLYLDIRDLFVDTLNNILSPWLLVILRPVLKIIEQKTFRSASHINLVSRGFSEYFSQRYPQVELSFFSNGIDDEFLGAETDSNGGCERNPIRILYAGNIGEGQGLHNIIPKLSKGLGEKYEFVIVGDGGRRETLENVTANISNVRLLPPVGRDKLIEMYTDADILFLHLNDYEAFEKVLPSKIFEYAATGKPILAGVAGYSAEFIREEVNNAEVFNPNDSEMGIKALKELSLGITERREFVMKYSRRKIMGGMSKSIIQVMQAAG